MCIMYIKYQWIILVLLKPIYHGRLDADSA